MKKILEKIRNMKDSYKILLFRWWFSAAVCFFIAMGLQFGNQGSTFELVFGLGLGIGVANLLLFNSIISSVFDIERRGKIANKKMSERSIIEGVWYMLSEILKSMIAVYIVSWIYQGINVLINLIGNYPDDHIGFALEPICFGIFFTIVYQLLGYIWDLLVILASKIFKKGKDRENEQNI